MGNLGIGEIVVIIVFALIVLGPDRLPTAGKQVGKALAEFRRVSSGVRADLQDALDVSELKDTVNEFRNVMDPRKLLADTLAPLDNSKHTDTEVDKPLSASFDPVTNYFSTNSTTNPPLLVPSPDGEPTTITSPQSVATTFGIPAPLSGPGRDILDDPEPVL